MRDYRDRCERSRLAIVSSVIAFACTRMRRAVALVLRAAELASLARPRHCGQIANPPSFETQPIECSSSSCGADTELPQPSQVQSIYCCLAPNAIALVLGFGWGRPLGERFVSYRTWSFPMRRRVLGKHEDCAAPVVGGVCPSNQESKDFLAWSLREARVDHRIVFLPPFWIRRDGGAEPLHPIFYLSILVG
jgi:hypothetical protein